MSDTQSAKDYPRADSYRVAVAPYVPDDGRTPEGLPKSRRRRPPSRSTRSTKSNPEKDQHMEELRQELEMDEHKIPLEALLSRFATDPVHGLTTARVKDMQDLFGMNKITPPPEIPAWVKVFKNLFGGFSLILWVGAALCLITFSIEYDIMERAPFQYLALGIVLALINVGTGIFSFINEQKGANLLKSFKTLTQHYATVIRDDRKYRVPAEDLVMGDVVEVKAGERIPADIRIISAHGFKVDNSVLTGALEPQSRSAEYTHENPLETLNMIYCASIAIDGTCRGIVISTGDRTLVGRISYLSVETETTEPLLIKEVTCIMHTMTVVGVWLALIFFIIGSHVGFLWLNGLVFLVGMIVAVVPESLMAVVTICLTLTAKRLYSKNLLVKHLDIVESLGATSAIVVDKTGVITQNKVNVSHIWIDNTIFNFDNSDSQDNSKEYKSLHSYLGLARVAVLCNNAEFKPGQETKPVSERELVGNSLDSSLIKMVELSLGGTINMRIRNRRICEIPFTTTTKFQASVHETENPNDPSFVLLMKGAPERLIERCSSVLLSGKEYQLDANVKEAFGKACVELGSMGEKVVAFCDLKLPTQRYPPNYPFDAEEQNFPLNGLRLIGLISFTDPTRASVPDAVSKCRTAGIRVVMVTGDHPITAKSIARSVGIFSEGNATVEDIAAFRNVPVDSVDPRDATAAVILGSDLKDMPPDRLEYYLRAYNEIVFARTSPQQKLAIVEGYQRLGCLVACTGIGLSDTAALKRADIGVSLGLSGTESSKEMADLYLLDDNFATIVVGIEEGRLLFDNLRKAVAYLLTSNTPEVVPYIMFLIFGLPLPLGTITILVIDMGTDLIPGISLAFEPPEHDIMKRKPRNPNTERLVDIETIDVYNGQIGMLMAVCGIFTYFVVMGENGFWFKSLFFIHRRWDSLGVNDFVDSYNQEWTMEQRKQLEWTCHSAFFVNIVMCQWANLIACKTRYRSLKQQGFSNHALNFALVFETVVAAFLIYMPGMETAFRLKPVKFNWWVTAIPFVLAIFIFDEVRRFFLRRAKAWRRESWEWDWEAD